MGETRLVPMEFPDHVMAGLANGSMVRTGGVIQNAENKKVHMWLREASRAPIVPKESGFPNLLNFIGSIASVLNLGATVAFGVSTLNKLSTIDSGMRHINKNINELKWTVEIGFYSTKIALEAISENYERSKLNQFIADLKTASELAWTAQMLPPNSNERKLRLENALPYSTNAAANLVMETNSKLDKIKSELGKINSDTKRIAVTLETVTTLDQLRLTLQALDLKLSIYSENNTPPEASEIVANEVKKLRNSYIELVNIFLRGNKNSRKNIVPAYGALLNKRWSKNISAERLGIWAKRYDPSCSGGLSSIMDEIRLDIKLKNFSNDSNNWKKGMDDILFKFADNIDGLWEDFDRLNGHITEMCEMPNYFNSLEQCREALQINELPDDEGKRIVTFAERQ